MQHWGLLLSPKYPDTLKTGYKKATRVTVKIIMETSLPKIFPPLFCIHLRLDE